jgi:hypothetical protein
MSDFELPLHFIRVRGDADPKGHPSSTHPLPQALEDNMAELVDAAYMDGYSALGTFCAVIAAVVDLVRRRGARSTGTALLVDPVNPDVGVTVLDGNIVFFLLEGRRVVGLHAWGWLDRENGLLYSQQCFLKQLLRQGWALKVSCAQLWRAAADSAQC